MLKLPRARSLFSRVFVHGLTVLLASSATFVALTVLLLRPTFDRRILDLGSWMAPGVCSHLTTSAGEQRQMRRHGLVATAYSADGRLLGSMVTPPIPPLAAADVARLRLHKAIALNSPRAIHAFWCYGTATGAYVELGPPPPPRLTELAVPFALAVLVVALASVPFARSIAQPIAELVRVTKALGEGELATRTNIVRSDEVGELGRAFNRMADRLQRLILAEQELLANVSHELRTPLARIRVVLEIAQENPRRAESLLQEIGNDLGDLERLVETVMETMRLDLSSSSAAQGAWPVRLEPTDIVALVRDAQDRFQSMHPERHLELSLPPQSVHVNAESRLVRRLLDNLLDNARKYSDELTAILLRLVVDEDGAELVRIEVVDHGIGIGSSDLPHVFELFFRGDRSRSRATGGAGLGLALVKKIVDAHGWRIAVCSTCGVGTTVCITLPRSGSGLDRG